MSNTAEVTPYEQVESSAASEAAGALAMATIGVAALAGIATAAAIGAGARGVGKLLAENDDERDAKRRYLGARTAELLRSTPPRVLRLRQRNTASLVATAQKLGYRVAAKSTAPGRRLMLSHANGETLVLSQRAGNVDVASNPGREEAIHALARQDVLDRALKYLGDNSGGAVEVKHRQDGTVELRAEPGALQPDGEARLTAHIDRQGIAHVDIEGIRGGRCEKILQNFADAVGGQAKNKRIKPDYYRVKPGEPARVKSGR
jgi:hypothetical protein